MVLVCHEHKFIFLKTHKTASTSVEMLFEPFCAPPGHVVTEATRAKLSDEGIIGRRLIRPHKFDPRRFFRVDWRNHMTAAQVYEQVGPDIWNEYRKFTTVRNPFDRVVSHFHYRSGIKNLSKMEFSEIRQHFQRWVFKKDWVDDSKIGMLNGKCIIDHAIYFENMRDDILKVAGLLGVPISTEDLTTTKSTAKSRKNYAPADYYDQKSADHVRKKMAWVFDNFDYSPELPEPQTTKDELGEVGA